MTGSTSRTGNEIGKRSSENGETKMKKAVIAIVPTLGQAEAISSRLHAAGFEPRDISVLFPDRRGAADFGHEHNTKAPEGAATGAGLGGVLGGTLGLLAGIGALAIPGLGPFIAAGPIMAALSGVAAGATLGGVTGALVGMGIPEYEARMYEGKLRSGNILISVHTDDAEQRSRALAIFKAAGIGDVSTQAEASVPGGARPPAR
jgi:hypothetical protein